MKLSKTWETVKNEGYGEAGYATERLKVPGGWVVSRETWIVPPVDDGPSAPTTALALCFVPDSGHKWELEDEG